MSSTTCDTSESPFPEHDFSTNTPDAPDRNRATSGSDYFNIKWSEALKGLPPAITMSRSNITQHKIILSTPPGGLLFKRRLWNRETDHGRLCDPDGWQGSMANQERLEEQRQINQDWLEERNLLPLDPSVFKKIDWKKSATLFEIPVSPKTILIEGGVVESPWTQAVTNHGSLNNSRRYHARLEANQQFMIERGESPLSVDTFTAINWYTTSSNQDHSPPSSPQGNTHIFPEDSSSRYDHINSRLPLDRAHGPPTSPPASTDSLSSFADLISRYNDTFDDPSERSGSSIGRTRYPYPSPREFLSQINDHNSRSFIHGDDSEPVIETASIALVIAPRSSKSSMLSAAHASQARRSPRTSQAALQDDRIITGSHTDLKRPFDLDPGRERTGGRATQQGRGNGPEPGWPKDTLPSLPVPEIDGVAGPQGVRAGASESFNLDVRRGIFHSTAVAKSDEDPSKSPKSMNRALSPPAREIRGMSGGRVEPVDPREPHRSEMTCEMFYSRAVRASDGDVMSRSLVRQAESAMGRSPDLPNGLREPLSPEVRLVVIRGRVVRQGNANRSGGGWSRESLLRNPVHQAGTLADGIAPTAQIASCNPEAGRAAGDGWDQSVSSVWKKAMNKTMEKVGKLCCRR